MGFFPSFFFFTDARIDYLETRRNNSTRNGRMPRVWAVKMMPQVRHPVLGRTEVGQRSHAFPFCLRSVFALHKMRIVMFNGLCKVHWVGMKGIWTLFLSFPSLVEWCWASSFALPLFLSLIRANNTNLPYKGLSSPQKSGCYYDNWQSHHESGINFFQIQMFKLF